MNTQLSSIKAKERRRQGDLCHRCSVVDWPRLIWEDHSLCGGAKPHLFRIPESTKELLESDCPMCPMWACEDSIDRDITSDDKDSLRELIVGCICRLAERPTASTDSFNSEKYPLNAGIRHIPLVRMCTYFGGIRHEDIWSISKLHDTSSTPATRIVDPNIIDYEAVLNWLESCKSHHSHSCHAVLRQTIPGFKVIDCETLQVISAPQDSDFTYVTLSYVWGSTRDPKENFDHFPPTIRDAITVTSNIGHRYLWVDQVCINQNDLAEKQDQIRAMDYIYSQSQLVIIAAAGDSVYHGLPGVSNTPEHRSTGVN
ncbi:HET domain-containing protein [Pyrenophora tritici-repentis]|nr:HET domain-containing protein [Pyrenophora tritici-repentis]